MAPSAIAEAAMPFSHAVRSLSDMASTFSVPAFCCCTKGSHLARMPVTASFTVPLKAGPNSLATSTAEITRSLRAAM